MKPKNVLYLILFLFILLQINPVLSNPDNWSYYVHDHQGNTRVVLDDDGDIKSWYDYYPYGKIQRASIAGNDARFKFTGKEFDSEDDFDMYYFGARYYDPEIAGWLVTDPVSQYHSPYSYVGGNPVNYVDPNGEFAFSLGIAFASWVATKVGQGITRGIGDAFGLNASIQTDMSYSAGFSSNPGFVTDTGIPGGLGLSYTGNFGTGSFGDDDGLFQGFFIYPDWEELKKRAEERLRRINIALSGGSLGSGFSRSWLADQTKRVTLFKDAVIKHVFPSRGLPTERHSFEFKFMEASMNLETDLMLNSIDQIKSKSEVSTFGDLLGINVLSLSFGELPISGDRWSQMSLGIGDYWGIAIGHNYSVKDIYGRPEKFIRINLLGIGGVYSPVSISGSNGNY